MYPSLNSSKMIFSLLGKSLWWGVLANMIITYVIVYLLVPGYFSRRKYIGFFILSGVTLVIIIAINIAIDYLLNPQFRQTIGLALTGELPAHLRTSVIRIFGNPPLICCLFLSIKTLKSWHLEQLRTEVLDKENASAELQLLKAQIHPHFLFNTLNNIYSFSLSQSGQAGILVNKLSGMLSYMIHECDEQRVPVERELKLIEDYMGLEKVRYGKRLDMDVAIHGNFENKLIAPLLMIPFIENSFKHGTSQMLRRPWIRLEITAVESQLFFKLSNSKPSMSHSNRQNGGIGLINVKKRLKLLYGGRHQLDVESTDDTFTVNLQLLLEEGVPVKDGVVPTGNTLAYV